MLALLETISNAQLTPYDWQMLSKASLSGGDYLLWKSVYADQCQQQVECNAAHQIPIMAHMLKGEGLFSNSGDQVAYPLEAYQQISLCGTKAWKALPTTGVKTEELPSIRQGPDEPYQDFVSRLLQAINRLVIDAGAGQILVKQLAFENADSTCKAILQSHKKKGDLSDFIRLCADVGPSYSQGNALAMALQKF